MEIGRLGWLQIASIIAIILLVVACLALYKHNTYLYFKPIWGFIFSVDFAAPPIVTAIIGFLILLVTGKESLNISGAIIDGLRKNFFLNQKVMSIFIVCGIIFFVANMLYVSVVPAKEYKNLVEKILGSEADDFKVVKAKIAIIEKINPVRAENLTHVYRVFEIRQKLNSHEASFSKEQFNSYIRALSTNYENDVGWNNHPLRKHALAEAYSLYAQSLRDDFLKGPFSKESLRGKAIALYSEVAKINSRLVPTQLRASAALNIGNIYYYASDFGEAKEWWGLANTPAYGGPNSSAWGNHWLLLLSLKTTKERLERQMKLKIGWLKMIWFIRRGGIIQE